MQGACSQAGCKAGVLVRRHPLHKAGAWHSCCCGPAAWARTLRTHALLHGQHQVKHEAGEETGVNLGGRLRQAGRGRLLGGLHTVCKLGRGGEPTDNRVVCNRSPGLGRQPATRSGSGCSTAADRRDLHTSQQQQCCIREARQGAVRASAASCCAAAQRAHLLQPVARVLGLVLAQHAAPQVRDLRGLLA